MIMQLAESVKERGARVGEPVQAWVSQAHQPGQPPGLRPVVCVHVCWWVVAGEWVVGVGG